MNPGAVLAGLAAAVLTVTYIARPFRKLSDVDRQIETWVAAIRSGSEPRMPKVSPLPTEAPAPHPKDGVKIPNVSVPDAQGEPPEEVTPSVAFCYQCGRPVRPHHRFCPGCGADLREDEV